MENQLKIGFIQAKSEMDLDLYKPLFYGYLKSYVDKYFEFPVVMNYLENLDDCDHYHIIGISATSQSFTIAKSIGKTVKARNKKIITIIGGHHITYMPETLAEEFDLGVMGEGEETFLELVRYFHENGCVIKSDLLKDIRGIVFHNNHSFTITPKRDLIEPMDRIPLPDRSGETTPYLFTSRGCPYKCSFCSSSDFWDRTRFFSAEYVVAEVEHLIETSSDIRCILILDDLFIVNHARFKRFVELIEEKKCCEKVSFVFSVRANLVNDELCEDLKRINTAIVAFGAESGSDRVLDVLQKHTTVDMNQRALDILYKYKIPVRGYFIVGVPTETEEDVRNTYEFLLANISAGKLLPRASVNILMPLPGTEMWKEALRNKIIDLHDFDWERLSTFASYKDSQFENIDKWIECRKKKKSIYMARETLPESRLYELMSVYENAINAIEETENINGHLSNLESQIIQLNRTVEERNYQIGLLKDECDRQTGMLKTNVAKLEQRVQELQNSSSWKITAPLRAASSQIKALRRQKQLAEMKNDAGVFPSSMDSLKKKVEPAKRHTYDYDIDLSLDTAPAKVIRMVGHNKRVLEIGAGPGSITRMLRHHNDCCVTGVEIDASAIPQLSTFCEAVFRCDLNNPEWASRLSGCGIFDVVVAADVFEHLNSPHDTLAMLKPFISSDGFMVISLPHVGHNAVIASILDGDFEYRPWGLLDSSHIRFFGLSNMQHLMEKAGYRIMEAEFVVCPPDQTELAHHWQNLSPVAKSALEENRHGSVYQVVMKVRPSEQMEQGIQLLNLSIPDNTRAVSFTTRTNSPSRLLRRIRGFLQRI